MTLRLADCAGARRAARLAAPRYCKRCGLGPCEYGFTKMREIQAWAYQHVGNTAAEAELWDIVGRMIAAEREACAQIADDHLRTFEPYGPGNDRAQKIAAAIRARGESNG